jgi:hypothetical protein
MEKTGGPLMARCQQITDRPTNQTCDRPATWLALVPDGPMSVKCVWQHRCKDHLKGGTE